MKGNILAPIFPRSDISLSLSAQGNPPFSSQQSLPAVSLNHSSTVSPVIKLGPTVSEAVHVPLGFQQESV